MQDKEVDKYNHQREDHIFYDYFRNNLEDHELPVEETCWIEISASLNPPKRKYLQVFVYSGIAVAILLLVFFVGLFYLNKDGKDTIVQSERVEVKQFDEIKSQDNIYSQNKLERGDDELRKNERTKVGYKTKNRISIKRENKAGADTENIEENNLHNGFTTDTIVVQPDIVMDQCDEKESTRIDTLKKEKTNYDDYFLNHNDDIAYTQNSKEKRTGWGLRAAVSLSGSNSKIQDNQTLMMDSPPLANDNKTNTLDLYKHYGKVSDVKYDLPISFGLLVSKNIGRRMKIETGITYSYLSTKFTDSDGSLYSATMKLHYIGVPVNVGVDVWQINSRWNVYASGGFAVEKGIRSNLTQELPKANLRVKESHSISGLQWSLNGSVGLSYRFYKGMNIYAEPRLSYYFDNDQPISIRTEKQTVFSLNAGLRYEF